MKRKAAVEKAAPEDKKRKQNVGSDKSKSKTLSVEEIKSMEEGILSSTKNYNDILVLLNALETSDNNSKTLYNLSGGLVRIFGKLAKNGALRSSKDSSESQEKVKNWLLTRYGEFKDILLEMVKSSSNSATITTALTVLIKLLSVESNYMAPNADESGYCPRPLLNNVIRSLLTSKGDTEPALELLAGDDYLDTYDDLRYYFYREVAELLSSDEEKSALKKEVSLNIVSDRIIDLLMAIKTFPDSDDDIEDFYFSKPSLSKSALKHGTPLKQSSHKTIFQKAWIAALSLPMTADQYKAVLIILHKRIIPRMMRPQLLMDFLTDAYNSGGAVSVLALNGLFSLMQKYNLDYPDFYKNLYALFDSSIMHVKYRSRFFRLVDLFLSSTHLPATIMASFIKAMSRLCLFAPPSAIIATIPFIYNQLKRHPTCMVMIHNPKRFDDGYKDPFDSTQRDPLNTNALESSLWELETLQSHYHPNVASLAKILGQPFRKPHYNLEDFLDHSYKALLDAEFTKNIKNQPPLEFESYDHVLAPTHNRNEDDDDTPSIERSYIQGWVW